MSDPRHANLELIYRNPTVAEFTAMTAAVGFKPHDPEAIAIALTNSWCSVCAEIDGTVVGMGRVVGDGAMHFYVTGIMVLPSQQRRGIGARVVEALLARVRTVPYANTLVEALPLPGLDAFYASFGFAASRQYEPGMHLWLNTDSDAGGNASV